MRAELDRSGLPLVGREREVDAITVALETARSGTGTLLCIIGEGGIGKTRLAVEATRLARATGFTCAWGSGWSDGGSPPLWPWPSIVEQLGDDGGDDAVTAGATPGGDPEAARFARFRSVSRSIGRAAERGPLLVVLDNAQAADAGALLLARFVIRSLAMSPVMFVVTARDVEPDDSEVAATLADIARDGTVLRPGPLSVPVVRDMLRGLHWTDSERRVEEVHRLTGGNPLFINELVASGEAGQPTPTRSVRSILELRTRSLLPEQKRLLRVVAILGAASARTPVIAAVADVSLDVAESALAAGVATGVIARDPRGTFVFGHDLLAEAAIAGCSPTERATLHERAAQALAGDAGNVDRASAAARHHLALARLRSDPATIESAATACRRAARMLVERFAYEAAAELLTESIDLHDRAGLDVPPEMLLGVARAQLAAGNLRQARPWFWRASERAESAVLLAEAALGLGGIWVDEHRNAIDHVAFMALIDRALDGLATHGPDDASGRPDLRARLEVRRAAERAYLGQAPVSAVGDAVDAARHVGDPLVVAESLSLYVHTMLGPASAERRGPLTEEMLVAATASGDEVLTVMGVLWRTVHQLLTGDARAERSLNELRERADGLQVAAVMFVVAAIDVMRLLRKGLLVEAELAVQQCFELGTSIGDADAIGYYGAHLMNIRWLQHDAASVLPLAREVANSPTLVEGDLTYLAAMSALAAMAGETEEARGGLRRVLAGALETTAATSSNWMCWMFCIIEAAAHLRDDAAARRAYDLLLPYRHLPVMGSLGVACFGSAERSLGIAARTFGDIDLAVAHLERAVTENRRLGNVVLAAISAGDLGVTLIDRGGAADRARAHALLGAAIGTLEDIGLPARAEALHAFADAHAGAPVGRIVNADGTWRLSVGEEAAELADSIGVRRLVQLLERPFVDVPVAELVGGLDQTSRQELMDSAALRSYRDRVSDLRAEIDEAESNNDFVRAERFRTELDDLLEHLSAAASLGNKSRQFTSSQERARVAVRKSLSRVFDEISAQSPRLGGLLQGCVRTGNVCRFEPQDPVPAVWQQG